MIFILFGQLSEAYLPSHIMQVDGIFVFGISTVHVNQKHTFITLCKCSHLDMHMNEEIVCICGENLVSALLNLLFTENLSALTVNQLKC